MQCLESLTNLFSRLIERRNGIFILAFFLLSAIAISPISFAQVEDDEDENTFDESQLFIELNDTDGDLGIQAFVDGGPYKKLKIVGEDDKPLLIINNIGSLALQGLTELFFESSEPSFDELSPEEFFERFPEGEYNFEGRTLDNKIIEGDAEFTHLLAAPPVNINVSGEDAAEDCEDATPLPVVNSTNVVIDWDPVTLSHPEIGTPNSDSNIVIMGYKLIVDREEPELLRYSVDLPPEVTEFQVPDSFIVLGEEFKFEIQTFEESGNITSIESCFEVNGN